MAPNPGEPLLVQFTKATSIDFLFPSVGTAESTDHIENVDFPEPDI